MIEMLEVSKIFQVNHRLGLFRSQKRSVPAVQSLSLQMEPGEIVGLLGLNGAGKTTTIRMLATLLEPTSGVIRVDGAEMGGSSRTGIRQKVNMIAGGERMLYWRLTGYENLEYFGKLYGLRAAAVKITADRLLEEVGLSEARDTPVEQYSKGMKQRLQIARGLMNDPAYLFLDEPTLGLDAPIARQLRGMVKSLARDKGKGILLTSHYLQEVEELCDRVYVMNKGKLLLCDRPERIVASVAGEQTARLDLGDWHEEMGESLRNLLEECMLDGIIASPVYEVISLDEPGHVRLSIKGASSDKLIAELLPWASRQRLTIIQFASLKPTLEDAIIKLSEGKGV